MPPKAHRSSRGPSPSGSAAASSSRTGDDPRCLAGAPWRHQPRPQRRAQPGGEGHPSAHDTGRNASAAQEPSQRRRPERRSAEARDLRHRRRVTKLILRRDPDTSEALASNLEARRYADLGISVEDPPLQEDRQRIATARSEPLRRAVVEGRPYLDCEDEPDLLTGELLETDGEQYEEVVREYCLVEQADNSTLVRLAREEVERLESIQEGTREFDDALPADRREEAASLLRDVGSALERRRASISGWELRRADAGRLFEFLDEIQEERRAAPEAARDRSRSRQ